MCGHGFQQTRLGVRLITNIEFFLSPVAPENVVRFDCLTRCNSGQRKAVRTAYCWGTDMS